jgi:hypothetical protein
MKADYSRNTLPVCVVVVSDYEAGNKTWADELACVAAIISDPVSIPAQIFIMAGPRDRDQAEPPPALSETPNCKIVFTDATSSVALKNKALELCSLELVAMVEADCVPERGWLSLLHEFLAAHPECDVVSGRTLYEGSSMLRRVMSLIDRAFLEKTNSRGQFQHYSANGALFKRKLLTELPLPENANPFVAVHIHHQTLQREGVKFGIETRAVIRHAFPSVSFVWDVRRNKGFQFATVEWRGGNGFLSRCRRAFRVARKSFFNDLRVSRRLFGSYCRRRDIILWSFMMFYVRLPEMSGAFAAGGDRESLAQTHYR